MNFSEFDVNEVTNSPTDARTFNRVNVYWVQLINETAFEIIADSRQTGEIRIPANKTREFKGHPNWPTDLNIKVRFNSASPTTDFLTIITSSSNGKRSKQC